MRYLLIVCCLLVTGAGIRDARADPDYAALLESLIDHTVIPDYENFARATSDLQAEFETNGCTDMAAMRSGYHKAMDAWQHVSHIRFGPVMKEDRVYRVQFWPDKRNITSRHLGALLENDNDEARSLSGIIADSVAVQGFPALERLLFDQAEDQPLPEPSCGLARSITLNLSNIAGEIAAEWKNSYRRTMLTAGPDNPEYLNVKEAVKIMHGALSTSLQILVNVKIAPVLGESREASKPRRAESWRSARAMRNIAINIETALRLYEGGDAHSNGFDDILLQRGGDEEHAVIAGGLIQSLKWAQELDEPIADVVSDSSHYSKLSLIAGQLAGVQAEVNGVLVDALGLSLGFNALDGD